MFTLDIVTNCHMLNLFIKYLSNAIVGTSLAGQMSAIEENKCKIERFQPVK